MHHAHELAHGEDLMNRCLLLLPAALWLFVPAAVFADDDDDQPAPAGSATPALSPEQQEAVGVVLAHPVKANVAPRIEAYGQVLDPASLITDAGRAESSRAAARAASAEAQRMEKLYSGNTDVSLKALQGAQAAQIEAQSQAQSAASTFALQWGPLAKLPQGQRQNLIGTLGSGTTLLVRADLPGHISLGAVPKSATLVVDGIQVPARVLGLLQRGATDLQSVGLLLQADRVPAGLGPGARLPVTLLGAPGSGVLVPKGALLYGDQGAYVYRQLHDKSTDGKLQYAPVVVKLLQPSGDAWLVAGLDDDDLIVTHGAGVLWSLQGLGSFSAEEEDHD